MDQFDAITQQLARYRGKRNIHGMLGFYPKHLLEKRAGCSHYWQATRVNELGGIDGWLCKFWSADYVLDTTVVAVWFTTNEVDFETVSRLKNVEQVVLGDFSERDQWKERFPDLMIVPYAEF